MGRIFDIAATLLCIGAGVYLLSSETVANNSYLEVIAHGIGIYFLGKGLFIARSTHLEAAAADALEKLANFAALRHDRETRAGGEHDYSGLPG